MDKKIPNEIFQRPQNCIYGLFTKDDAIKTFQTNQLHILHDGHLQIPSLSIYVYVVIIGESHFAQIYLDKKLVAIELLACVDPAKIGFKPNFHRSFKESSNLRQKIKDGDTKFQIEAIIHPPTNNREQFVPTKPSKNGIRIIKEFPGVMKPRTIVVVEANGQIIEIKTLHEYVLGQKIEPLTSWTKIYLG